MIVLGSANSVPITSECVNDPSVRQLKSQQSATLNFDPCKRKKFQHKRKYMAQTIFATENGPYHFTFSTYKPNTYLRANFYH